MILTNCSKFSEGPPRQMGRAPQTTDEEYRKSLSTARTLFPFHIVWCPHTDRLLVKAWVPFVTPGVSSVTFNFLHWLCFSWNLVIGSVSIVSHQNCFRPPQKTTMTNLPLHDLRVLLAWFLPSFPPALPDASSLSFI